MNNERIAKLLASGLQLSQVASVCGVSPARISQLKSEASFISLLEAETALVNEADIEEISISAKYMSAEHALIDQVIQMAPNSELRDVTNALRVISDRQEKKKVRLNPISSGQAVINTYVQIALPNHISHTLPEIQLNSQREVIAIGEKNLAPLASSSVTKLFATMDESSKALEAEKRAALLLTASTAPEGASLQEKVEENAEGEAHFLQIKTKETVDPSLKTGAAKLLFMFKKVIPSSIDAIVA